MEIARTTWVHIDVLAILDIAGLIVLLISMNVSHHPAHSERASITSINTRVYVMMAITDTTATSKSTNACRRPVSEAHVWTTSKAIPVSAQPDSVV